MVEASKAGRIYIDVQLTKDSSALSHVGWRVAPWIPVPFSHCKSQLGFDWSPALQC